MASHDRRDNKSSRSERSSPRARKKPTVGVNTYRDDPLYPRIVRVVAVILENGKVVAPVDVLVKLDMLSREKLNDWRHGRVPFLERAVHGSLTRLSRLLRILAFHAHDLKLVPFPGNYPRSRRFSKTSDARVEKAYARHFRWPGKGPFHLPKATQRERHAAPETPTGDERS